MNKSNESSPRYIVLDIHKQNAMVVVVNREVEVLSKPRKITNEQLPDWATAHLCSDDLVVIDSTTNVWYVYDLQASHTAEINVANPIRDRQTGCLNPGSFAGRQPGPSSLGTTCICERTTPASLSKKTPGRDAHQVGQPPA